MRKHIQTLILILAAIVTSWTIPGHLHPSPAAVETETEQGAVRVQFHSRSFAEGDVVMLHLQAPPFTSATVRFNGSEHRFIIPGDHQSGSFALLPLGLDMGEGDFHILLAITFPDGSEFRKPLSLPVTTPAFPSTILRVDPRFTTPSPEELRRIERERELVSRIYDNPHPAWLGDGNFTRPLDGGVSSPFGVKRIFNDVVQSRHRGVDLRSPPGTPVHAGNAGLVVLTRSLFFAGDTVIIDHGTGLFTIYCHLSEITVQEGSRIEKKDIVGTVGATGRATGPHLHWGARLAGINVDPLSLLDIPFEDTGR